MSQKEGVSIQANVASESLWRELAAEYGYEIQTGFAPERRLLAMLGQRIVGQYYHKIPSRIKGYIEVRR